MPDLTTTIRLVWLARWVGVAAWAVVVARLEQLLPMGDGTAYLAAAYGVPLAAGLLLGRWGWTAVAVGGLLGARAVPADGWVGVMAATLAAVAAGQRCRWGWPFDPGLSWLADVGKLARLAAEVAVVQGLATGLLATAAGIDGAAMDGATAGALSLVANVILGAVIGGLWAGSARPLLVLLPAATVAGLVLVTRWTDGRRPLADEPAAVWWAATTGLAAVSLTVLALAAVARERLTEAALRDRLLADLKTVSADLIRRRAAMESLLDQLPVGVLFLDQDGHVVRQNRQYRDRLRLPTDFPELRPDRPGDSGSWQVARPDGSPLPAAEWSVYRAVREGKATADREARVLAADGVWRDVSVSSAPATDPDGGGAGSVFVVSDLTARKQAERDRLVARIGLLDDEAADVAAARVNELTRELAALRKQAAPQEDRLDQLRATLTALLEHHRLAREALEQSLPVQKGEAVRRVIGRITVEHREVMAGTQRRSEVVGVRIVPHLGPAADFRGKDSPGPG